MSVIAGGKFFALGQEPFGFRAVEDPWHGRSDANPGAWTGELARLRGMGFTVVSTPLNRPLPDRAALEAAGLRLLLEAPELEWSEIAHASRAERRRTTRAMVEQLRHAVGRWQGGDALLGVALGPRRPPPGWSAREDRRARAVANALAEAVHEADASLLVGWRSRWPSPRACPADADFLLADVTVPTPGALAHALNACHALVGDRPLVLGDVAVDGSEEGVDRAWLVDAALERGVAGTVMRPSPGDAEADVARALRRTVRDLDTTWPSLTVVVNAYNAEATLAECLAHCQALDYPSLEVVVVDDGSTDATRAIAAAHAGVRLVAIEHAGLAEGRNVGFREASGDVVAYLDADAYPSPEWPWFVALAALQEGSGGAGGPNVPPPGEPLPARVVAHSPGGPLPQVRDGFTAHHLPGCNMAFWRHVLDDHQGFDPVIEGAEDLELEWRVLDAGLTLGYHPAALAWHHRRGGLRPYLRQQRRNGRGQAMLERRYPERFPPGFRLQKLTALGRRRARRSGEADALPVLYLSLPAPEHPGVVLAHQWGMPAAVAAACTAPLALVDRRLGVPALAATAYAAALFALDALLVGAGRRRPERGLRFRTGAAVARLLRPLAFRLGHVRGRREFREVPPEWPPPPAELAARARQARRLEPRRAPAR